MTTPVLSRRADVAGRVVHLSFAADMSGAVTVRWKEPADPNAPPPAISGAGVARPTVERVAHLPIDSLLPGWDATWPRALPAEALDVPTSILLAVVGTLAAERMRQRIIQSAEQIRSLV